MTEDVFTNEDMYPEWNVNFFQDRHREMQHSYSNEFSIGRITFKTILSYFFKKSSSSLVLDL